jgi:hypothetical protein
MNEMQGFYFNRMAPKESDEMSIPFRWDITKREQLGSLVAGPWEEPYPGFLWELQRCCARILALSDNSDLVFIGRSPENIHDYLCGLLADTAWRARPILLNISMYHDSVEKIPGRHPSAVEGIYEYFKHRELAPRQVLHQRNKIAFVDFVASGTTFKHLFGLYKHLAGRETKDLPSVKRKLRFVGITWWEEWEEEPYRWNKESDWVNELSAKAVKNVSVSYEFWDFLAQYQEKTTDSHRPECWDTRRNQSIGHDKYTRRALTFASHLYRFGCTKEHRFKVARLLSKEPSMKHRWFRSLISQLRN